MISKDQTLYEIGRMQNSVEKLQRADPADKRYQILLKELNRVRSLVEDGWPLPDDVAANLRFGLFAVRELEDKPELSDDLTALDRLLKARQ